MAHGFFNTDDAYQAVGLLYDSFANRLPDASGLVYWAEAVRSGAMTIAQVAESFTNSAEFHTLTDGMTHSQFVQFVYHNTLDRDASAGELQSWNDAFDHGLTNGGLLATLSQSNEHFDLIATHVTNGIDYL